MKENPPRNIRIAVVDDDKMILKVFSSMLAQLRYSADLFSDSREALDLILTDPARYQLIISDINMPDLDGVEFAKKVRFVLSDLPIMFMTGAVTEQNKKDALALGNVTFLEKPFPLGQALKDMITHATAKPPTQAK